MAQMRTPGRGPRVSAFLIKTKARISIQRVRLIHYSTYKHTPPTLPASLSSTLPHQTAYWHVTPQLDSPSHPPHAPPAHAAVTSQPNQRQTSNVAFNLSKNEPALAFTTTLLLYQDRCSCNNNDSAGARVEHTACGSSTVSSFRGSLSRRQAGPQGSPARCFSQIQHTATSRRTRHANTAFMEMCMRGACVCARARVRACVCACVCLCVSMCVYRHTYITPTTHQSSRHYSAPIPQAKAEQAHQEDLSRGSEGYQYLLVCGERAPGPRLIV